MNKHHNEKKYRDFASSWYDRLGKDPRINEEKSYLLMKKGFFAANSLVYDFNRFREEDYAKDREFFYMHPINGWFTKLIDDKRFISIIYRNTPELLPELSIGIEDNRIRFIIEKGKVVSTTRELQDLILAYIHKYGSLFLKHAGMSGGRGAEKIDVDNYLLQINQLSQNHAYLVNNFLANEEYLNEINPFSINTIRAYFFRVSDKLKLFRIFQRFGTMKSNYVDNISAGGIACEVDIETGVLSSAYSIKNRSIRYDKHPDNNFQIEGYLTPNWKDKLRQIENMLKEVFFLDYGAFDIAVTNNGLKILEINSLPGQRFMQMNRPAFIDKEFKEFCISKGYESFDFDENDEL